MLSIVEKCAHCLSMKSLFYATYKKIYAATASSSLALSCNGKRENRLIDCTLAINASWREVSG